MFAAGAIIRLVAGARAEDDRLLLTFLSPLWDGCDELLLRDNMTRRLVCAGPATASSTTAATTATSTVHDGCFGQPTASTATAATTAPNAASATSASHVCECRSFFAFQRQGDICGGRSEHAPTQG